MENNLILSEVSKEIINLDDKIERMGKLINKNVEIYDNNFVEVAYKTCLKFDDLKNDLNKLYKRSKMNSYFLAIIIGYIIYKEFNGGKMNEN